MRNATFLTSCFITATHLLMIRKAASPRKKGENHDMPQLIDRIKLGYRNMDYRICSRGTEGPGPTVPFYRK